MLPMQQEILYGWIKQHGSLQVHHQVMLQLVQVNTSSLNHILTIMI